MGIEIPAPRENGLLVKVEACGVCHGDAIVKDRTFPGLSYPRIPVPGLSAGRVLGLRAVPDDRHFSRWRLRRVHDRSF